MLLEELDEFLVDGGMFLCEVLRFARVVFEVKELDRGLEAVADGFPFPSSSGLEDVSDDTRVGVASLFSEFPVKGSFGDFLRRIIESGDNGSAVCFDPGNGSERDLRKFSESRKNISEGPRGVVGAPSFDGGRPMQNHGNVDAAIVEITLHSLIGLGGFEELGVGSTFVMRSVVGGENDEGIFEKLSLFECADELADIVVERSDHARERGMGMGDWLGIIPSIFVCRSAGGHS